MIGDLIISIVDEETSLRLYLGQRYRIGGGADPVVGFNLADPTIITAIRNHDQGIFDALESMIDQACLALELPTIEHAMGLGWEYHKRGGTAYLENYVGQLKRFIDNPFACENDKERAIHQLKAIEKADIQKKTKERLIQKRRSSFQANRDHLMLALIERDGYECANCGEVEGLSIDHIIPLSKGGSDELENLQLLCKGCNSSKGDSMPEA